MIALYLLELEYQAYLFVSKIQKLWDQDLFLISRLVNSSFVPFSYNRTSCFYILPYWLFASKVPGQLIHRIPVFKFQHYHVLFFN